mgnify:CR=1 FL=1
MSALIPEEYGGMDLDFNTGLLFGEAISTGFSFATTIGAHTSIGSLPIVYYGTEDQKAKYLPKIATAEYKASYALTEPDAMIHDPEDSLAHCLRMFGEGVIKTVEGGELKVAAQSVCVHGDGPAALATARHIKDGLQAAGFEMKTLPQMIS